MEVIIINYYKITLTFLLF